MRKNYLKLLMLYLSVITSINMMAQTTVTCGTPVNVTDCYFNNDLRDWTFQSSTGGPLTIDVTAGYLSMIAGSLFEIYDGTSISGTLLHSGFGSAPQPSPGTIADLSGIQVTSSTNELYVRLIGNVLDCASGAITVPLDFTVTCDIPCTAPTATFTVVEDCINGFTVNINTTNMGSSTTYDVISGGSSVGTISATGTITVGPFTNGTAINLTLEHDTDNACDLSTTGLVNGIPCPVAPANDDCGAPITLTVYPDGMTTGNELAQSTTDATHGIYASTSCDGSLAPGNLDMFYTFTVPAGKTAVNVLTGGVTGNNIKLALWTACGGTELLCQGRSGLHNLTNLTGGTTYILQIWHDNYYAGDFDIVLELAVCTEPSALNTSNLTQNSANLNWTAAAIATGYNWEVQATGDAQGTTTTLPSGSVGAVNTVNTGTTLTASTAYDFFIQSNCGADSSTWVGPISFTTIGINDCSYTIEMFDSFGDGWDGASLDVNLDGITTNYTIATGSSQIHTFIVTEGDSITITYLSGIFDSEISYNILNAQGDTIFSDGNTPTVGLVFSNITSCQSCPKPSALNTTNITENSANLNWTAAAIATGYNWEVQATGDAQGTTTTLPSGNVGAVTTVNTGTTLAASTTYDFYVQSDCGADSSAWVGPVSFTSLAASTFIWTGTTNTDWNTATNWSTGTVPTAAGVVTIPSTGITNFPVISPATTLGNITVDAGASLTVETGIVLDGTFTNNGTVTLQDSAYLDDFTNATSSFVGNITVETKAENGVSNDQRLISSAVNTPNVSEIADDLNGPTGSGLQGTNGLAVTVDNCATPSLTSSSNYGNLFEFDETKVVDCPLDGWVVRSAGSLTNGKGYSAYLTNNSTFDFTGAPNTGNVSVAVTKGTSNVTDGEGWNLIGNPYPSPIKRNDVITAGGLNASYFVTTGVYEGSYTAYGVGSNIAIGQGFQVEVAATGTVGFTNAMRTTGAATWYETDNWFTHKLEISVLGTQFADKTTLFFNEEATNAYEPMYDVTKRKSSTGHPSLSTFGAGKDLTLNGLSINDLGETVPMNLDAGANGSFTLSFTGKETFPANTTIYVKDLQENVVHNIANGDYSFTATTNDNAARFEIIFVQEVALTTTKVDCEGNEGSVEISNTNFVSERTYEIVENNTVIASNDLANLNESLTAGTYAVNVNDQYGGTQIYTVEIEAEESIEADFTVSNTELLVDEMLVLNNTTTNSNSVVWWINGTTQIGEVNNATYAFEEAGIYEVVMEVNNAECVDTKTETITVVNKTTAIETVDGETINFYPNPTADVLQIDFNKDIYIRIVDYIGTTVVKTTEKTIDLSHVTTGIYFLEVYDTSNKLIALEKIMKK